VDQLLHHVQSENTSYKNLFLQPDHVPSENEVPLSYMIAVLTIFLPFVQMSEHLSPVALGGLVVSVLATGPKVAGSNPAEDDGF
jgi:hypothetical protein